MKSVRDIVVMYPQSCYDDEKKNENMKNKSVTNPFKIEDKYIHLIWKTILDMSKSIQEKKE